MKAANIIESIKTRINKYDKEVDCMNYLMDDIEVGSPKYNELGMRRNDAIGIGDELKNLLAEIENA